MPSGESWGKRTTAHRWLGRWVEDGTWRRLQAHLLGAAELAGAIDWERASLDGSFSPRQGGGEGVARGYKGKGVTLHSLVEGGAWPAPVALQSTPANVPEPAQVIPLLNAVQLQTGRSGRIRKRPHRLPADAAYDLASLRQQLRRRGIQPLISQNPRRRKHPKPGRPRAKPLNP